METLNKQPLLEGMCSYYEISGPLPSTRVRPDIFGSGQVFDKLPYRKKVLECPTCGRRVQARTVVCHDNCCISYLMPVHKPKMWWKTKTKDRRLERKRREKKSTIR